MTVKNLTLKEAREKLGAKQDELGKVFAEAKTDDGYDFAKVTVLGAEVKGSIAVAEKVKAMNAELDELAEHAETLEAAEKAASDHEGRSKARRGFVHPASGGDRSGGKDGKRSRLIGSLGDMVVGEKAFEDWAAKGFADGVSISFDDVDPFDMLAAAAAFDTMGAKALMTTAAGFAPENMRMPGFVEAATRPIELLDIIPTSNTGGDAVVYMEETTRVHGAAEALQGGDYAESEFVFTEKSSPVRKVTDSLPVTDEQIEDVSFMQSYINGRLSFGVRQRLDTQCAVGDGNAPNLRGLKNVVGTQAQALGGDPVPDAFFKAMTKIRLIGRAIPTHHIMHPTDWQGVRLLKTVDGVYIFGSPSEAGPDRLWGLPVAQCSADDAGTGYVGSFQPAWVSLSQRSGVDVQIGYVGTQFKEGKRTVRASLRAALTWFRPAAFCKVTGL